MATSAPASPAPSPTVTPVPAGRTLAPDELAAIQTHLVQAAPPGMSEAEYTRWMGPRVAAAVATAEHLPPAAQGPAFSRFVSNLGALVNPVSIGEGLYQAVRHPIDTVGQIAGAAMNQGRQAVSDAQQGRWSEAVGHGVAAALPVIGPIAAQAGQQIGSGDVAGGLGTAAGLLLPIEAPRMISGAMKATDLLPDAVGDAAREGAADRVARVMTPTKGANAARFSNMAQKAAPGVAEDLGTTGAPWSRGALADHIGARLQEAGQALDEAHDARLVSQQVPTAPILSRLDAEISSLQAHPADATGIVPAVKSGQPPVTASATDTRWRDPATGAFRKPPDLEGRPLGRVVEPAPNHAELSTLRTIRGEVHQLGPVAPYEAVRVIRQAWDKVANLKYMPSTAQDLLRSMGDSSAAATGTAAMREGLGAADPVTAAANAKYSLYSNASKVLKAADEAERTRPGVARAMLARLTAVIAGAHIDGGTGAAAGMVFGPALDHALPAGVTTQLKTAALLQRFADALQTGQVGPVDTIGRQLRRLGTTGAAALTALEGSGGPASTPASMPAGAGATPP